MLANAEQTAVVAAADGSHTVRYGHRRAARGSRA